MCLRRLESTFDIQLVDPFEQDLRNESLYDLGWAILYDHHSLAAATALLPLRTYSRENGGSIPTIIVKWVELRDALARRTNTTRMFITALYWIG